MLYVFFSCYEANAYFITAAGEDMTQRIKANAYFLFKLNNLGRTIKGDKQMRLLEAEEAIDNLDLQDGFIMGAIDP